MRNVFPLLIAICMIAMSCSNDNSAKNAGATNDAVITKKEINSEVIKTVANLNIEGMTCSAGCGGKIQQDLQALKGVKETKLDFEENRAENLVSVEYNPSELTEQDLIKCVNAIMDGKYHVKSAEIVTYKGLQSSGGSSAGVKMNDGFGKIFYVFDLLRSVSKLTEYSK